MIFEKSLDTKMKKRSLTIINYTPRSNDKSITTAIFARWETASLWVPEKAKQIGVN